MSSNFISMRKKKLFSLIANSYRSVISCTLATKTADLFAFNQQPICFQKLNPSHETLHHDREQNLRRCDFSFILF